MRVSPWRQHTRGTIYRALSCSGDFTSRLADDGPPCEVGVQNRRPKGISLSIAAAMHFDVLVIRYGVEQAQNVLAGLRVEALEQHGVGRALLSVQFQLGIVHDQISVVPDAPPGAKGLKRLRLRTLSAALASSRTKSPDAKPAHD